MSKVLSHRGEAAGALAAAGRLRSPRSPALEIVMSPVVPRSPISPAPEFRASCSRSIHHQTRVFKPP
jgi:hypothetical protein